MKNKKILGLLLIIPFIAACNKPGPGNSTTSEIPPVSISEDPTHIIERGSIGGMLIDISNDFMIEENGEFLCSYKSGVTTDPSYTVTSSDESILTIQIINSEAFKLLTHKPGDVYLTIRDSLGLICYNKVVHVGKCYTPETILNKVCDNDIYVSTGIYGNYRFAVTERGANQVMATISGADVGEQTAKAIFELKYNSVADYTPFDSHFYEFDAVQDLTNSTLTYEIKAVLVSKCGDQILAYYGNDYLLLEAFTIR